MSQSIKGSLNILAALTARRVNKGLEQVAKSASAVDLSLNSASEYYFTGTEAQVVNLPASGVLASWGVLVENGGSAGNITVQLSGVGTVATVEPGKRVEVIAKSAAPGAVADWIVRDVAADAGDIAYDNNSSGLTATNVQGAIDEVEGRLDIAESDISTNASNIATNTSNIASNLAAIQANDGDITDIRSAIGIADGDVNLGSFSSNNWLVDNSTVKAALEALDSGVKSYIDNEISGVVSGTEWQDSVHGIYTNETDANTAIGTPVSGDRYVNSTDNKIYAYNGSVWVEAVSAPTAGMAAVIDGSANSVALFGGSIWSTVYWERTDVSGNGLSIDSDGIISLSSTLAGAGLAFNAGELSVNVGNGLDIAVDTINLVLDGATLSNSASGLKVNIADDTLEDVSGLRVKLDAAGAIDSDGTNGLAVQTDGTSIEISSNALRIASGAAGAGLGYDAGELSVNAGDGIKLDGDNVAVDLVASDSGLEISGGKLQTKRDFESTFTATTEWGAASGGFYTITVLAATHGQGSQPSVELFELSGSDYLTVFADEVKIASNGDVSFRVPDVPNARFAGKVKIKHSYV